MRDQLRFLKGLAERPRMTGAVAPSGEQLANAMTAHIVPEGSGPIIELGPGTGVVTRSLIARGVAPERIIAIEYSPDFCRLIAERFPGVTVIRGDAYDLDKTLDGRADKADGIISSLPLVSRPLEDRIRLIEAGLARIPPERPFIQFSYTFKGPVHPVPPQLRAEASGWIWRNMPPARVWLFRKA